MVENLTKTHVQLTQEGKVANLVLNRPRAYNALHVEMIEEMIASLKEIKESDAEVLLITGNGKGFCAGGDIKTMLLQSDASEFDSVMNKIKEMVVTLYTLPKLTISAIHGPIAGLGLSMALATDYAIASRQAILAMNFIGIGLVPDGGGHFFLKNRIGEHKAKQVIWEGKNMSANEALQLGIIDEVAESKLTLQVDKKVQEWLQKPRQAMLKTKAIYTEEQLPLLVNTLEREKKGQIEMRQTKDHQEGIQAFIEKRTPVFQGV